MEPRKKTHNKKDHTPPSSQIFPHIPLTQTHSDKVAVMLSRAFTKSRRFTRDGDGCSKSLSIDEYDESCMVGAGLADDLPLIFCYHGICGAIGSHPTLGEVLRSSIGVIGESRLGISEKVVLVKERKVYTVKRFRKVCVKRREFGKRIERLARISRQCEYLLPVSAYLYAKRIKFVLSDHLPMGSLADLLAGGRERGQTALDWNQRLRIVFHIARAIAFIHTQSPPHEKNMQLNVHGNIKASNVMINLDFSACLSDYGFTQLAERVEVSDTWQPKTPPPETEADSAPLPPPLLPPPPSQEKYYTDSLCQKCDIYNFGVIVLDMLGGSKAPELKHCIIDKKEEIKEGGFKFFEFNVEGKERKQALQVLDIALACTNTSPEARPTIEQILLFLGDVRSNR